MLQDISDRAPDAPPVVVFPGGAIADERSEHWPAIRNSMEVLFDLNAAIVVSAGNNPTSRKSAVNQLPAVWADIREDFPLIVAGSVNNDGILRYSKGPEKVTVWAPGFEVQCADRQNFRSNAVGTSFSAGIVSHCVSSMAAGVCWMCLLRSIRLRDS